MAEHHYVYAILAEGVPVPSGLVGLMGNPIKHVQYRELAAAASLIDPETLRATGEDVLLHESIVETLRQSGAALPVRFGTVLNGQEAVERALAERYDILRDDLHRLGDTVEFGLTVLWQDPAATDDKEPDGSDARTVESSHAPGGSGARYLQARVAEYRREMALREKAEMVSRSLDTLLCPLDHRRTILPTPRIAIRAAYLLQPSGIDVFHAAFEEARAQHPDLRFLLSGPWPPYSFVTVAGQDGRAEGRDGNPTQNTG